MNGSINPKIRRQIIDFSMILLLWLLLWLLLLLQLLFADPVRSPCSALMGWSEHCPPRIDVGLPVQRFSSVS